MKRTAQRLFLLFPAVFLPFAVFAEEFTMNGKELWKGLIRKNIIVRDNKTLSLAPRQLPRSAEDDLRLPLDRERSFDTTGNYAIKSHPLLYTDKIRYQGTKAAVFEGKTPLVLLPDSPDALFSPGTIWGDFTIQFWLYSTDLQENTLLLRWNSLDTWPQTSNNNPGTSVNPPIEQSLYLMIERKHLEWKFDNFFMSTKGCKETSCSFSLKGRSLFPHTWSFHVLRYDSRTGLLEYLVDGKIQDSIYTTPTTEENHTVYTPFILKDGFHSPLYIGASLYGVLDSFLITKKFKKSFAANSLRSSGTIISPVFDTKTPDSSIDKIDVRYITPKNSKLYFFYKSDNNYLALENLRRSEAQEQQDTADPAQEVRVSSPEKPDKWIPFSPFKKLKTDNTGRYVMIKILFFPDSQKSESPFISSFSVHYKPQVTPSGPVNIKIYTEDEAVVLEWKTLSSVNLGGYRVYFGTRPGHYIYPGSPVDVGDMTEALITGLTKRQLYYFKIVSYSKSDPPILNTGTPVLSIRP